MPIIITPTANGKTLHFLAKEGHIVKGTPLDGWGATGVSTIEQGSGTDTLIGGSTSLDMDGLGVESTVISLFNVVFGEYSFTTLNNEIR